MNGCYTGTVAAHQPAGDPFLSTTRLHPETPAIFSIRQIIFEEFEDDAELITGHHGETLNIISEAILYKTPIGEQRLRAFLRHLRSLLGRTPSYVYSAESQMRRGIGQAQAQTREADALIQEQRDQIVHLSSQLTQEREEWRRSLDTANRAAWDIQQLLHVGLDSHQMTCQQQDAIITRTESHRNEWKHQAEVAHTALNLLRSEAAQLNSELITTRNKFEAEAQERQRLHREFDSLKQLLEKLAHCDAAHLKYEVVKAHRRLEQDAKQREKIAVERAYLAQLQPSTAYKPDLLHWLSPA